MPIEIVLDQALVKRSKELIDEILPSSIKDLWSHYRDLSSCLWEIRNSVNDFIDSLFPKSKSSYLLNRTDLMFDDSAVTSLENKIQKKMNECSKEAKRLTVEKGNKLLKLLKEANSNVEK